MKLNKGCPLYRYEIAEFFKMNEKKLYRFLKKKSLPLESGMVMPSDLDKIEALILGKNSKEDDPNEGDKNLKVP